VGAPAALRSRGRPGAQLAPVREENRAREPWHREAHLRIPGSLSPKEQGSRSALRGFLDDVIAVRGRFLLNHCGIAMFPPSGDLMPVRLSGWWWMSRRMM